MMITTTYLIFSPQEAIDLCCTGLVLIDPCLWAGRDLHQSSVCPLGGSVCPSAFSSLPAVLPTHAGARRGSWAALCAMCSVPHSQPHGCPGLSL